MSSFAQILDRQTVLAERIEAANLEKRELVRRLEALQSKEQRLAESRLFAAIQEAIAQGVLPSARRGNTHEDGAETVGLLVEKTLRKRILDEALRRRIITRNRFGKERTNYRAAVMTCVRVGLAVLEQIPLKQADLHLVEGQDTNP